MSIIKPLNKVASQANRLLALLNKEDHAAARNLNLPQYGSVFANDLLDRIVEMILLQQEPKTKQLSDEKFVQELDEKFVQELLKCTKNGVDEPLRLFKTLCD